MVSKRLVLACGAAVAATGLLVTTSGALGGFTASIIGQGNNTLDSQMLFSVQQFSMIEGSGAPVEKIANPNAPTESTGASETQATLDLSATSILPGTITYDPTNSEQHKSTFRVVNKSLSDAFLNISGQNLVQQFTDEAGVVDSTSVAAANLVGLKVYDNGDDLVFGTEDDVELFDGTLTQFMDASNVAPMPMVLGEMREITTIGQSLAVDSNADMGFKINNVDIRFTLTKDSVSRVTKYVIPATSISSPFSVATIMPGAVTGSSSSFLTFERDGGLDSGFATWLQTLQVGDQVTLSGRWSGTSDQTGHDANDLPSWSGDYTVTVKGPLNAGGTVGGLLCDPPDGCFGIEISEPIAPNPVAGATFGANEDSWLSLYPGADGPAYWSTAGGGVFSGDTNPGTTAIAYKRA